MQAQNCLQNPAVLSGRCIDDRLRDYENFLKGSCWQSACCALEKKRRKGTRDPRGFLYRTMLRRVYSYAQCLAWTEKGSHIFRIDTGFLPSLCALRIRTAPSPSSICYLLLRRFDSFVQRLRPNAIKKMWLIVSAHVCLLLSRVPSSGCCNRLVRFFYFATLWLAR